MFYSLRSSVLVAITLFAAPTLWAKGLTYSKDKSEVKFKAIGNPSALVINGEADGEGADGQLLAAGEQASGEVSFNLASLKTGISLRDRHMKDKYLHVDKFPKAVFKATKLPWKSLDAGTGMAVENAPFEGILSLHGVEKPVQGTVTAKAKGADALETEFQFKIKLTDFGIEIPSFAGVTVAETVDVTFNGTAAVSK